MNFLIDNLKNLDSFNRMLDGIENKKSPISLYGIINESVAHLNYALNEFSNKQILILTNSENRSRIIWEDLVGLGCTRAELYEKKEVIFYNINASSHESSTNRIKTLNKLIEKENTVVVASIEALIQRIMKRDIFSKYIKNLKTGDNVSITELKEFFLDCGYEFANLVETVGEFSVRGGIVDFFSPNYDYPFRVEFFDDEIDSLRMFDPISQKSLKIYNEVKIIPVRELIFPEEERENIESGLKMALKKQLSKLKGKDEVQRSYLKDKFNHCIEAFSGEISLENRDLLLPFMNNITGSIFDYFNECIVYFDEYSIVRESGVNKHEFLMNEISDLILKGELLPEHEKSFYNFREILTEAKKHTVIAASSLTRPLEEIEPVEIFSFNEKGVSSYNKKLNLFVDDLNSYKYRGYKIVILVSNEEKAKRLSESLFEMGVENSLYLDKNIQLMSSQVFISVGNLEGGFEYIDIKFIIYTDKDVFGVSKRKRLKSRKARPEITFSDLEIGGFVVHETHGIGIYEGVIKLDVENIKKDYISISYSGSERLYLPVDQLNLLQKYIGGEGVSPKVTKLSSNEWKNAKRKTKRDIDEMAAGLVELYARREKSKGYAFSKDTDWQRQFEDLFPYEETDGQIYSTEEIKGDMEKDKPMDRLLCGDVGYGKTEVAMRAAFKAVSDGKQVAFLVPTTILAQQHYNTIVERFLNFPISCDYLSRFKTKKQIDKTLDDIRKGQVDIIVGTHRLLSSDVKFKDLGLLVVDEEQRFGVKHKERLKEIKESVDVLTLTATPIPRTLHISLSGIRNMSVLTEPPDERFPVQTYVMEENDMVIQAAINRELDRGGQVYYVYNRVDHINLVAEKIKKLVPDASVCVAHGQMSERELENIILAFLNHEYDILVCTTIIETGLDIKNVNTIIIQDADKFGLSQLYQLRGRVGRSDRLAYAYLNYGKNKVLSEVAAKRLKAIMDFTEFGSGFRIAMRDLEIRGAGNMLGLAQHGHMGAIGYELYIKYLNMAVRRLKGEIVKEDRETLVELNFDAYIDYEYIPDEEQKIISYKKIAAIESEKDYMELMDEFIDRYGDPEKPLINLMDISHIRHNLNKANVKSLIQKDNKYVIEFYEDGKPDLNTINSLIYEYGKGIIYNVNTGNIIFEKSKMELKELRKFASKLMELKQQD